MRERTGPMAAEQGRSIPAQTQPRATEKLPRAAITPMNPLLNASRAGNLPHVPGIRVGDYIFLSGMVPVNTQTGERSHGPIAEQVHLTLSNMVHMLESAGSTLDRAVCVHVVLE